ncbi:MAG: Tsi3 family protein [Gammaproteobacteria bacterium]|nr:Tsi3 family protein [Gammaproteobacteria bacterium]
MKKIILFLLLLSFISCEINNEAENKLETLSHENGLTINIRKNVNKFKKIETGFKINFSSDDSRAINELEIKKTDSSPNDLSSYETKTINGVDYFSKLETVNEGSGGSEHTFRIWKSTQKGGILLEHYIQQDLKPIFDQDWEIIQSAN